MKLKDPDGYAAHSNKGKKKSSKSMHLVDWLNLSYKVTKLTKLSITVNLMLA
jgi:hypothetical protein